MGSVIAILLAAAFVGSTRCDAETLPPIEMTQMIQMAEHFSPDLQAAHQHEKAAGEQIRTSLADYYPTLEITAVDSLGFPGSSSAPSDFNGLMDSPYRSGWSTGAFSRLTLFDLRREFGVQVSKAALRAANGGTQVTRLDVDLDCMNLFMDALLNHRQSKMWADLKTEIDRLYQAVKKFVRNGQYSEVTQWLLKSQSELADQRRAVFELGYTQAVARLELLAGIPTGSLLASGLVDRDDSLDLSLLTLNQSVPAESPLISRPRLEADVSHSVVGKVSAQNWPRLIGMASAGAMQDSRFVPVENYSLWLGVTIPIFEGFRISSEVAQARAESIRSDNLLDFAKLKFADAETKYKQEIQARQIEVAHLTVERDFAKNAMTLAEHRLLTFVGELADVRDSLRNYEDAVSGLTVSQVELYRAKFTQTLIQGGVIAQKGAVEVQP